MHYKNKMFEITNNNDAVKSKIEKVYFRIAKCKNSILTEYDLSNRITSTCLKTKVFRILFLLLYKMKHPTSNCFCHIYCFESTYTYYYCSICCRSKWIRD